MHRDSAVVVVAIVVVVLVARLKDAQYPPQVVHARGHAPCPEGCSAGCRALLFVPCRGMLGIHWAGRAL